MQMMRKGKLLKLIYVLCGRQQRQLKWHNINADNFNEKVIEKLGSSVDADEVDVEFDGEKGIVISATYSTGDYICDTINGSDINCTIYRGD